MTKSQSTQAFTAIGIDVGKDVFHIVGFDDTGAIALRKKIRRSALVREFEKLPSSIVGLEACQSAHFISRTLRRLGHTPRIIPAFYVKPSPRARRTTTTMLKQSPKRRCGLICASSLRRPRTSLICRRSTACEIVSSRAAPPRSTKFAAF